jgi:hypothetical protein
LFTSLESSTVLTVEPVLVWNPSKEYPWLLYNTPIGMVYFDLLHGVNFWPPDNLRDQMGNPREIQLPNSYDTLPPTDPEYLEKNVLFANSYFKQVYRSLLERENFPLLINTLDILSFLTPAAILGW